MAMRRCESGIRLWRDSVLGLAGTELLAGGMRRVGPLIRNEVTIAVMVSGRLRYRIGRLDGIVQAGQVVLVAAGEVFTGEADEGSSWRAFYPDLATVTEMAVTCPAGPPPRGPQPSEPADDPGRARRLIALHRAIEANRDNPPARQQAFAEAVGLALTGVLPPEWPCRPRPDSRAIRRAMDCVRARFHDPELSVGEMAAAAGYSSYHFMRTFQAVIGLTAHAYVVQCRVHAARALLAAGVPAAEVAHTAGFADQSHLIRQFKALHGLTPGQYTEACRGVAAGRPAAPGERLRAPSRG